MSLVFRCHFNVDGSHFFCTQKGRLLDGEFDLEKVVRTLIAPAFVNDRPTRLAMKKVLSDTSRLKQDPLTLYTNREDNEVAESLMKYRDELHWFDNLQDVDTGVDRTHDQILKARTFRLDVRAWTFWLEERGTSCLRWNHRGGGQRWTETAGEGENSS